MGPREAADAATRAATVTVDERRPAAGGVAAQAVLALACAAQFMVVLDVSVVNVALPSIQASLGFDQGSEHWIVNGYALVFAGFLLLGGRLADLYGRKRIFLVGLALFAGSSLVGGLAGNLGTLVAARATQGLGAAVLAPATLTILTTTFREGAQRTRALATWTAVGAAGGAAGNLIGGVLTQFLSWRWILLINVPIGALAIVLAARYLVRDHRRDLGQRLDFPGAVLVTAGLASLSYGITQTQTRGWSDVVAVSALGAGTVALAGFVVVEGRFARAPLIPLRLFRVRSVSTGNVVMLLGGACLMPMWYFLSLFMQNVLHYGPWETGVGFLPHTLVIIVGSRLAPRVMEYVDARTLIVMGAAFAAVGFLWQGHISPDIDYLSGVLWPGLVISAGGGLLIAPITTMVTSKVRESDAGAASGLMNTTKQVGGVLGLAVLVTVAEVGTTTPEALTVGYGRAFLAIAGILGFVAVVALTLPSGVGRHRGPARGNSGRTVRRAHMPEESRHRAGRSRDD
ncbi:MFS transporter [Longimycelium tulufanense]|uniref:MFS transporter n=1 Tax=Longimycelium tulufanense TaxID=907463 RepID=A0A8J3FTV7_9PSEU|nr:MFS transporter [Longimycelium tulufanense]GGM52475.1 MFS transporter [Longimycelium tulufanense]